MYINESLANGLKERLWMECEDFDSNPRQLISNYLKKHKIKLGSRTSAVKLDKAFRTGFKRSILASAQGGSRENPILLYSVVGRESSAVRGDWEEKMFMIGTVSIDMRGKCNSYKSRVRIGEHAVMRVLQRHPDIYNDETKDFEVFKVIPELRTISYMAEAMCMIFFAISMKSNCLFKNINTPFVSAHGLFLGEYCHDSASIDIRTFVADHQFTKEQLELAIDVRASIEDAKIDMLPFLTYQIKKVGGIGLQAEFFSKLVNVAPQFAKLAAWHETSSEIRQELQLYITSLFEFFKTETDVK